MLLCIVRAAARRRSRRVYYYYYTTTYDNNIVVVDRQAQTDNRQTESIMISYDGRGVPTEKKDEGGVCSCRLTNCCLLLLLLAVLLCIE